MRGLLTQAIAHPSPFNIWTACLGVVWVAVTFAWQGADWKREGR